MPPVLVLTSLYLDEILLGELLASDGVLAVLLDIFADQSAFEDETRLDGDCGHLRRIAGDYREEMDDNRSASVRGLVGSRPLGPRRMERPEPWRLPWDQRDEL